jgi:hypothetical protein
VDWLNVPDEGIRYDRTSAGFVRFFKVSSGCMVIGSRRFSHECKVSVKPRVCSEFPAGLARPDLAGNSEHALGQLPNGVASLTLRYL